MQHYVRRRAAPALPLYSSPVDGYSKMLKQKTRSYPRWMLAAAALSCVFALLLLAWLSTPVLKAYRTRRSVDHEAEQYFVDERGARQRFASLMYDPASVTVSVVVPAYNEEDRMPEAMAEMTGHLSAMEEAGQPDGSPFSWEIIIVDDGSSDGTAAVAAELTKQWGGDRVRVLRQVKNTGKGGAVRKGMMRARGEYLLMADADGATKAADLSRLLAEARGVERGGLSVAIGSRAHMQDGGAGSAPASTTAAGAAAGGQRSVKRSALRRVLMWGFHTFVSMMAGGSGIKDTQCGFKLFSRAAARQLFPVQHIERWAFDVELVYLAARKRIPMVEVPVTWREMPGSKVDLVSASLQMARDIVVIRLCYTVGIWKDVPPPEVLAAGSGAGGAGQQGAKEHRVYGRFGAGSKAAAAVAQQSRGDRRTIAIAQEVPASVADMAAAKDRDSQGQAEPQAPWAADIDPASVGLQGRGRLGGAAAAAPGSLLEDDVLPREEQR